MVWSHAFGIIDRITSAQLAENPLKAQAFVGWDGHVKGPDTTSEFYDVAETYAVFYGAWMNGASLDQCIDMAAKEYPFPGDHSIHPNFPLGQKYSWIWSPLSSETLDPANLFL